MINLVQQEIKQTSLSDFVAKYKLHTSRSIKYPNLVQLKYDMVESPTNLPVVQQCRGMILDEEDGYNCIAWPFNKFFNYNEPNAATIDWGSACVQEKRDGSLIIAYYYRGFWHAATQGSCDGRSCAGEMCADFNANRSNTTFAELFWECFSMNGYAKPVDHDLTYMFELTSPVNRIVVDYGTTDIYLLGIRNRATGDELPPRGYKTVQKYSFNNMQQILDSFPAIKPGEQEGYVVVDKNYNRIKIKHPSYIDIHLLKSTTSDKRIKELIRDGEESEVIAYVPHLKNRFEHWKAVLDNITRDIEQTYNKIKDIESQKEFASEAKKYKYFDCLFQLRSKRANSVKEWMGNILDSHFHNLMDSYL